MINHVRQEDSHGCVIACIAMVAGKTYAEVRRCFPTYGDNPTSGIQADKRDIVLVRNGIWPIRHTDLNLYPDKLYIVSVPSLNIEGGMHSVVVDCTGDAMELLDPQMGNDGKQWYTNDRMRSFGDVLEVINTNTEVG